MAGCGYAVRLICRWFCEVCSDLFRLCGGHHFADLDLPELDDSVAWSQFVFLYAESRICGQASGCAAGTGTAGAYWSRCNVDGGEAVQPRSEERRVGRGCG